MIEETLERESVGVLGENLQKSAGNRRWRRRSNDAVLMQQAVSARGRLFCVLPPRQLWVPPSLIY